MPTFFRVTFFGMGISSDDRYQCGACSLFCNDSSHKKKPINHKNSLLTTDTLAPLSSLISFALVQFSSVASVYQWLKKP